MRQILKIYLFVGVVLTSLFSLEAKEAHTVICPIFHDDQSAPEIRHSFLGATLDQSYYRCFYGVGFISSEIKLDVDTQDCRLKMPRKNPVGIRNMPDCLGSSEDCQLICR